MYALMISPNKFPNGDAGAVRDEYFARIYRELGYEVYHIGMGVNSKTGVYREIKYFSAYSINATVLQKIKNAVSYKKKIEDIYKNIYKICGAPSLIHIYDIPKDGIEWAVKIAKENSIPIIHDSVEWYSPCEFSLGRFAYPYILKNRTNTRCIKKPISVIAISSYLERYFSGKGLNTIRVPVIMDPHDYSPKIRKDDNLIRIVYAGSPARKDYLKECVQAFEKLPDSLKKKFVFNIFGADETFVQSCTESGIIPSGIFAFGRVPREQVVGALEEADFSVLLRPIDERYTQAGFPTKSVEAMMNGCAMLCNLSSDLGMYLKDGENAVLVSDSTSEAMYKAFQKVAAMNHTELTKMREMARKTAEDSFYYKNYILGIKEFIEKG